MTDSFHEDLREDDPLAAGPTEWSATTTTGVRPTVGRPEAKPRSQAKQCSAVLALVLESRRKGRSSDCERKEREERKRAEQRQV